MANDRITETEFLKLANTNLQVVNAKLALQLAQQNHAANVAQTRAAHGMTPADVLNPNGSITRAPKAEDSNPAPAEEKSE